MLALLNVVPDSVVKKERTTEFLRTLRTSRGGSRHNLSLRNRCIRPKLKQDISMVVKDRVAKRKSASSGEAMFPNTAE